MVHLFYSAVHNTKCKSQYSALKVSHNALLKVNLESVAANAAADHHNHQDKLQLCNYMIENVGFSSCRLIFF